MLGTQSLSALLAAILLFVIAWSAILRDRHSRQYVAFTVFCFALCFWYLSYFIGTSLSSPAALWFSHLFALLLPSSAERFFRAFLAADLQRPQPVSRPVIVATTGFLLLLFGSLFAPPVWRSRLFSIPLLVFVFASLYYCLYLIYVRQRSADSRPEAVRLQYLFWGGSTAVTLAATGFIPVVGDTLPALGNVLTVIFMYFLSQTLFHYRLLDIKELLGKMVALSVLVLSLTLIYGLLLVWVGREQSGVFFFNTVVASFVILVLFEPMRSRVENRVNHLLFAERYAFTHRLRSLNQELLNVIEVPKALRLLLSELEESDRATHASIYLLDADGNDHRLRSYVGPRPVERVSHSVSRLFFDRLRQSGWLNREALDRQAATQVAQGLNDAAVATRNVLATLEDLKADICVALVAEERLLGLLNLRDDRLREAYATEELEQLRRLAAQVAITLRNSQIYQQMKERDRLAALGQMAAGLAHEIRNPLGAIKSAAQLLEGGKTDQDSESAEYLQIIVEEVDRLSRVVSQFLGYAKPDRGQRQVLQVNDLVHRTLQLIQSDMPAGITLNELLDPTLPQILADAEQLRQVLLNLALNGLQAIGNVGALTVRTGQRGGTADAQVTIAFSDDGKGIAEDQLSDIFIPFFTTKDGGTGLGLPICQRIVENHGGAIEVTSELGAGTTFTVVLPAAAEALETEGG